ncbi:MAG: pyruvate ferredoxin oxidoreductase [Bacillota bacterium]|jgi:pyruvate ferredoxin oxidoreductase alpha subunit
MGNRVALTGNEAVALAMKQIDPDVVAAYPITPQTDIVQYFSSFVSDGKVRTEFVTVESEHSAMSATIAASSAGARAMTATSSQGLALMWEMLYIAASYRNPIVMPVVNRALSGPINIHCDHSDTMGARDSGWLQLYSENAQEVYDNMIQAVRISEHPDVLLPAMVCQDGFITSHGLENLVVEDDALVRGFVGEYKPEHSLLEPKRPMTVGPLALQNYYFEFRKQQAEAMHRAKPIILDIAREYERLTGRRYGLFEAYQMDQAEVAVVVLNSTAGTAKVVVNEFRKRGVKAGLLKLRVLRPFPREELIESLRGLKAFSVMDRADSYSCLGGPLFTEIRSIMYEEATKPIAQGFVYGLGGRDVGLDDIRAVYQSTVEAAEAGKGQSDVAYIGVRE